MESSKNIPHISSISGVIPVQGDTGNLQGNWQLMPIIIGKSAENTRFLYTLNTHVSLSLHLHVVFIIRASDSSIKKVIDLYCVQYVMQQTALLNKSLVWSERLKHSTDLWGYLLRTSPKFWPWSLESAEFVTANQSIGLNGRMMRSWGGGSIKSKDLSLEV